jgi:hypothetical protein
LKPGYCPAFLCPTTGRALSVGTPRKEVNVVVSDAWNLVWILLVLVMVNRAVFCRRDEPMERILAFLKGLAEILGTVAAALREWRR